MSLILGRRFLNSPQEVNTEQLFVAIVIFAFFLSRVEMDRFSWSNGLLEINETLVIQQRGVRLYDGDDKVQFSH